MHVRLRLTTLVQTDPLAPLYVEARADEATADDAADAGTPQLDETHADTDVEDVRGDEPELG